MWFLTVFFSCRPTFGFGSKEDIFQNVLFLYSRFSCRPQIMIKSPWLPPPTPRSPAAPTHLPPRPPPEARVGRRGGEEWGNLEGGRGGGAGAPPGIVGREGGEANKLCFESSSLEIQNKQYSFWILKITQNGPNNHQTIINK